MSIKRRVEKLEKAAGDDTVTVRVHWDNETLPEPGPGVIVVTWPDEGPQDEQAKQTS